MLRFPFGFFLLFPLFLLIRLGSVHADAAPVSCRLAPLKNATKNTTFSVEILYSSQEAGACHGFIIKDKEGKIIQKVENAFWSRGEIWPSADGTSVAVLYGRIFGTARNEQGRLELYGAVSRKIETDQLELVSFFREGKKLASYRWKDLMVRPQLVQQSSSHTRWLAKVNSPADGSLPPLLEIETTSFRQYRFDTSSGKMLSAQDSPAWNRCKMIVLGAVKSQGEEYSMSNPQILKGEAKSEIRFRDSKAKILPPVGQYWNHMLCLEEAEGKLTATEQLLPFVW